MPDHHLDRYATAKACVDTTVIAGSRHVIQEFQDRPLTSLKSPLSSRSLFLPYTIALIAGSQHVAQFDRKYAAVVMTAPF